MLKILFILFVHFMMFSCMEKSKQDSKMELLEADSLFLLVGSYASAREKGIKLFTFDLETGEERYVTGLSGIANPSYLTVSSDHTRIYAVGENEIDNSSASALALDLSAGKLSLLNTELTQGAAPCYIALSPCEDFVLTANYNGGNISIFRRDKDGKLQEPRIIGFIGNGLDPIRQDKPHLHCIGFTPDEKYMLAVDLGTDCIHVFPINKQDKDGSVPFLDEDNPQNILLPPGYGPRHLCFSSDKNYLYLITELSGDVVVFKYMDETLHIVQTVKADILGAQGSADIHISPDGNFLYASNRLEGDGIAIFSINKEDGTLEKVGYQSTGIHPRNFVISPDGSYLLVACRDSNEIQIFKRDKQSGLLQHTGRNIELSKPTCLKFIQRK